jgi:hypothetical protein
MKIALIKQPIGIGDVFYLQKFAHIIKSRGYEILWPLRDDVIWIKDYVDGINFCKLSDDFPRKNYYYSGRFFIETDDFIFLSPDGFQLQGKRIMESKYLMINESDHDWYNYFNFKRNIDKENDLYYNVLGLTDESQYVFLNNMASVDVKTSNVLDDLSFNYPTVNLQIIKNFTLFDWCKVFENAIEIHTVHTGINYVLDKLNLKAKKYYMYQGLHHSDVQYIPFSKKPKYIPNT